MYLTGRHRKPKHLALIMACFSFLHMFLLTERTAIAGHERSTWSPPVNFSNVPDQFSDSPVLLCDQYQNVHALWVERDDEQAAIYYQTDVGGDWSGSNDVLVTRSIQYMDAAISPDDVLHLVWVSAHSSELQYAQAPLARAHDARNWQTPMTLATDVDIGMNVFAGGGTIRATSDGRLHLIFSKRNDVDALSHTVSYTQSDTGGQTWTSPVTVMDIVAPEPSDVFAGLVVDDAGRLHAVWQTRSYEYASFSELGYTRSTDEGKTWEDPRVIATGSKPFGVAMPAVFAFGQDEIHLTWDTPNRVHSWSRDGGITWSTPALIMDLGAAFGGFNKLATDSGGELYVLSATGGGVFSATWMGSGWSEKEPIDRRAIDPHTQQLVVCQGNRLHVVYHDRTGENEIWYSTKTTDATEIVRSSFPAKELPVASTRIAAAEQITLSAGVVTDKPDNGPLDFSHSEAPIPSNSSIPVLIATFFTAALVSSVVVVRLSRLRR